MRTLSTLLTPCEEKLPVTDTNLLIVLTKKQAKQNFSGLENKWGKQQSDKESYVFSFLSEINLTADQKFEMFEYIYKPCLN